MTRQKRTKKYAHSMKVLRSQVYGRRLFQFCKDACLPLNKPRFPYDTMESASPMTPPGTQELVREQNVLMG